MSSWRKPGGRGKKNRDGRELGNRGDSLCKDDRRFKGRCSCVWLELAGVRVEDGTWGELRLKTDQGGS